MSENNFYITILLEALEQRQNKNASYSLRAFARDLNIDASSLSKILSGKRLLSNDQIETIIQFLKLDPKQKTLFIESIHRAKPTIDGIKIPLQDDRFVLDDESYFRVIAEWEHYAVLSLYDIPEFHASPQEIATRLGIKIERSYEVIENLMSCELLVEDEKGHLVKSHPVVRTTEDNKSRARDASHLETLELGKEKLKIANELRDFSSSTLAVDMSKLQEAKMVIREFRMKMSSLLKEGHRTQVYQLAIQFYPLTDLNAEIVHESK